MASADGKATAMTVMTPVRRGWTLWLRVVFWIGRHYKPLMEKLERLSFIHYARWAIVKRIPYNGPPQEPERMRYKYLLFESNFNGTWDEYIDAFSQIVPRRMKAIWASSYGFPGPLPVGPFKDYIRHNEFHINHYYSAYPAATTTEVLSGLELKRRFEAFVGETKDMGAEEFSSAYERFLTDVQRHL
jgi:hypothetical protein